MDDSISRQAAIEAIHEADNSAYDDRSLVYDAIRNIRDLPSVQPRWVPVTEELPKEKGEYMVTVEYFSWHGEAGRMLTSARYTKTKGWHISNGKVTAWMPLPEPWKGE